jgi:DNA-binding NtrC family response regulator
MKVLIVDDEIEICQRLQREVKKDGCDVGYATSPVSALESLRNAEKKGEAYDLLILDIKMPEMDGLSLLKKIQEAASDLDVIIITGYGDEDKAIKSIRLGVVDYLRKPISLEDLYTAIFRVQQKRAAEQKMVLEHSILIVDDEKELCERIKRELKKEGYQVAVAYDGVEGLEYFKNNHVDAVISDIRMPKMSGLEMLKKCREIDDNFVPIIITAFSDYEKAVEALKLGVFNYFKKPILFKELISSLRKGIDQIYVRKNLSARKRELQIKTLEKMVNELEKAKAEVEKINKELQIKIRDLERFKKVTMGRELKIVELKERIMERSEVRGQKSEVRGQRSEVRSQRS